jgi:Zn-dependent peptidase ImmA (M78 family)
VAMHDFRRLPTDKPLPQTMGLRLEIRKAVERRHVALELAKALDVELVDVALSCEVTEAPETVAARIREALGVSIDQQRGWTTHYESLNVWRRAVERLGVLVFHADQMPVRDARGFSINDRPLPAIVLNAKDVPQARVFTLFHELTHLLLREGGLCDLHEEASRTAGPETEVFCNHVAGAVIAPESALSAEPLVTGHPPRKAWTDDEVAELARRFWMSREAMMRRLALIGAATSPEYERFRAALGSAPKKASKPGFISPSTKSLRNLGFLFTRLAVGAYREEVITGSDLADHLELKLKHLPKIEDALARGAALDEERV